MVLNTRRSNFAFSSISPQSRSVSPFVSVANTSNPICASVFPAGSGSATSLSGFPRLAQGMAGSAVPHARIMSG